VENARHLVIENLAGLGAVSRTISHAPEYGRPVVVLHAAGGSVERGNDGLGHLDRLGERGNRAVGVAAMDIDDARSAPAPFQDQVSAALGSLRSLFSAALDGRADGGTCLELAFRLHRYFATTNVAEGRFWLSRLLAANPGSRRTPYATYALGYLSYWSGDTINAVRELTAVVDMLEEAEDPYAARALIYLGGLLDDLDRGAEAVPMSRPVPTSRRLVPGMPAPAGSPGLCCCPSRPGWR